MNNLAGDEITTDDTVALLDEPVVVLLVDPSADARRRVTELRRETVEVRIETTIEGARSHLPATEVDCILTEYDLADGTGIDLLETVRSIHPAIPVILWTASGSERIASDATAADVTDYVPRREDEPFDVEHLLDRVRHRVAEYRRERTHAPSHDERHTLSRVCRGIGDAETRVDAFRVALEEVCETSTWTYGEVWVPDTDRTRLVCAATYDETGRFEELIDITTSMTFEAGEGLPGRVWASGRSESIPDVSQPAPSRYIRAPLADRTGLETAVGLPVRVDGTVEAVVVYYASSRRGAEQAVPDTLEAVTSLLESHIDEGVSRIEFALDVADATVWMLDPESGSVTTHPEIHPILDTKVDTIQGFLSEIHPADRDAVRDAIEAAIETDGTYRAEFRIEDGDTVRWVEDSGAIRETDDGAATLIGIARDVTEHKAREHELEQVSDLLDRTERIADVGGWELDPETGEMFYTDQLYDVLGIGGDEAPSVEEALEIVHESDRPTVQRAIESALETGEPFDVEARFYRSGEVRWLRIQGLPIVGDGDVETVRGAAQDVTERKAQESELDAARRRYQTLVDAAPDPIFVADADTGEILEANAAAAALRNQPVDEIVGLHQSALHPSTDDERYRELFEYHVENNVPIRQFEDGSPVYMQTADGERIPVSISTATIELDGRRLIHGIFRDISEPKRYQDSLKGVNTATRELLDSTLITDTEIARTIVDVATDVLDIAGIGIYRYDEWAEKLLPVAYTESLEEILGSIPQFSPGEGVAWRVYTSQEPAVYDDVRTDEDIYNPGTPIRRELIYPLGEYGVLIAGDTEIGPFPNLTIEILEILAATAQSALHRADRTRQLRERELEARRQTDQLERVERLNEEIRAIVTAIVQAGTRESIGGIVCESLCALEGFEGVWIGESNLATNQVRIRSTAGSPEQYLESIPLELTSDSTVPAVRAIEDRQTIVEPNLARDPHADDWRNRALLYQYRSVISVPLLYEGVLYGALTIYSTTPDNFDELTENVLTELGELIGYAINTINQRNALLEDGTVDLTFEISDAEDVFVNLTKRLSTTIRIKNISERSEDSSLVYVTVDDVDSERMLDVCEEVIGIEDVTLISDAEPALFEVTTTRGCIATRVADLGANIRSVTVMEDGCELHVAVPQSQDVQTFVRYISDQYPDVTLTTQEDRPDPTSPTSRRLLEDNLTERQADILRTAYYSGYFDRPRKRTGTDIADSLDISQPAFAKQLRVAQYRLLTALLE